MSIITNIRSQCKCNLVDIIHFHSLNEDTSEFLEYDMPYPLTINKWNKGYSISWALDGLSLTQSSSEYKFDIIDKIARTLNAEVLSHLPEAEGHYHPQVYDYSAFKGLDAPKRAKVHRADTRTSADDYDALFHYVRYDIYALKAEGLLYYEKVYQILDAASKMLHLNRTPSHLKSKARNMLAWTKEKYNGKHKDFEYKSKKDINADYYKKDKDKIMTTEEACKVANQAKITKVKAKIEMAIEALKFSGDKINKSRVARMANVHRDTVAKYWNEFI